MATVPLRVALVFLTSVGRFRVPLRFCEALLGCAAIAITGIIVQAQKLVDSPRPPTPCGRDLNGSEGDRLRTRPARKS
jgi:hypothetical protein